MSELTPLSRMVLTLLRKHHEREEERQDGSVWGSVYLDNAIPQDYHGPQTSWGLMFSSTHHF